MKPQDKKVALKQLWLFFSDANTRVNILIEECSHLQNTIFGLLPADSKMVDCFRATPSEDLCGIPQKTVEKLIKAGFRRPVIIEFKSQKNYAGSSPRSRALLSIWNTLGALIVGLVSNQFLLRKRYIDAVLSIRGEGESRTAEGRGAPFWFLAMRGYLIDAAFSTYTHILEHAHEKIIQAQENRAGTLPAPILLRRWNSALQGDFLSRYARHVDWESSRLIGRLTKVDDEVIARERNRSSISHTWAHHSTSLAKPFSITAAGDQSTERRWRFGALRSAYFYLEQPVLFPLLYHECAHLHFPNDFNLNDNCSSFFNSRRYAHITLSAPGIGATIYSNFWDHYTEEVWADCIAIALSGRSYLGALVLQLFAATGARYFSHHNGLEDEVFPLDTLGDDEKKCFEAEYSGETELDFWEARILIATKLCEKLFDDDETSSFCKEVRHLLEIWFSSGDYVFRADRTSVEHQRLWKYKQELTLWVFKTIWSYIEPHEAEIARKRHISSINEISTSCGISISGVVESFIERYISRSSSGVNSLKKCRIRLENVALDTRLTVASHIADSMLDPPSSLLYQLELGGGDSFLEKLCDGFGNWMRHDGSMAFRIALEWYLARISLLEKKADEIERKLKENQNGDRDSLEKFRNILVTKKIFNLHESGGRDSLPEEISEFLSSVDKQADEMVKTMCYSSRLDKEDTAEPAEIPVGTFVLGTLRPAEIARKDEDNNSPYREAIVQLGQYYTEVEAGADRLRYFSRAAKGCFYPLIGEYQYFYFSPHNTPTEREFYPLDLPQVLCKPRLVVQVLGSGVEAPLWAEIGRVSLIRYRYRHSWFDLFLKLREERDKREGRDDGVSMFISSAWEDVILITWHKDDSDLWSSYDKLNLRVGRGSVDVQSSVICPKMIESDVLPKKMMIESCVSQEKVSQEKVSQEKKDPSSEKKVDFDSLFKESFKDHVRYNTLNNRMGRHDYTVSWSSEGSTKSAAVRCSEGLMALPAVVWKRIESITHAYEQELDSSFATGSKLNRRVKPRTEFHAISMISVGDPLD